MPNAIALPEAAHRLAAADRVLVIGCSGGGKSTLSVRIAESCGLEYQSLDREVFWLPDWRLRDRAEQRRLIAELVRPGRWVMDGNNPSSFDLRVPRSDLIVWIRVPRWTALAGVARRVLANHGAVRVDMADGCPERLPDLAFLTYIWTFERRMVPRIIAGIDLHGPDVPVVTISARSEFDALLMETGRVAP